MINERIKAVQKLMKEYNIDIYYIPTSDYHDSEYVDDYFACRKYLSGFSGSAGVMVITQGDALLWADGRYYIQAANQIKGTIIKFMKWGDPNFPSPLEYIRMHYEPGNNIGFDGRVVSAATGRYFESIVADKNGKIIADYDLVDMIWSDRPTLPQQPIYQLDIKYSGLAYQDKLKLVEQMMQKANCNAHLLTSLDDIAWFTNLRGNDIPCTPVFLSYMLIDQNSVKLYLDKTKVNQSIMTYLSENKVELKDYEDIYQDIKALNNLNILIDKERVNYRLNISLNESVKTINGVNPTTILKAIKNETEIANIKAAHVKDGIAFTKFMYWIKNNIGKIDIDELSADCYLSEQRSQQSGFVELSFNTIAAYQSNAAMMHYSASESQYSVIKPEGMLLVDSGGQYYEGTTDITRTMAMGPVSDKAKKDFTLVLKGFIALSEAKFLKGCTGLNLDILARNPLWQEGIDYKCGTGHGVGYMLGVHEGPHGIKWMKSNGRHEDTQLRPGMIVTDEPGIYLEGEYGIRTENMLVVKPFAENEWGTFYGFDYLTLAPIDLDLINKSLLNEQEIAWLNNYHEDVYQKLSPALNDDEKVWLRRYTRKI